MLSLVAKRCLRRGKISPTILKHTNFSTKTKNDISDAGAVNEQSQLMMSVMYKRFVTTAEVTVSKIFPAGFGWQLASVVANDLGYQATDLGFAIATGLGDMTGVALGQVAYYGFKRLFDPTVDMKSMSHAGVFLGSAAFFSGAAWQPTVNALQALELPFIGVAAGTWVVCGAAFFSGMRLFRSAYSPFLLVAPPSDSNIKDDAFLSASIGGAAGGFVGTDVNYLGGEGNFLRPVVGVEGTDSVLTACTKAGSATGLGFTAAQSIQNAAYPINSKNWTE